MEEKMNVLSEEVLEEVAGGAGANKYVEIVNCGRCDIRSSPSASADNKLGYAYPGNHYPFYGFCGSWAKIRYALRTGYVSKKFVKVVSR